MAAVETRTHSSVHVLKGAVSKVLGARVTTSVRVEGNGGRLTVQCDRKPSVDEVVRIESEANGLIARNGELIQFEMERGEAEGHFGKAMYDQFPIPAHVVLLKIVRIPDWEVNCCAEPHVDSAGAVGRLSVDGTRFRKAKGLLEITFHVG